MFVIVEDLIEKAPKLAGWKFTGLKEPGGFGQSIKMNDHEFSAKTINFYPANNNQYPDDIAIVLTHADYEEEERESFFSGTLIYLENAFGELNTATKIDDFDVAEKLEDAKAEIPIEKLADYIIWREKEFVEKYENQRIVFPEDAFSVVEAVDEDDFPLVGVINTSYKDWEYKTIFPWLLKIEINFDGKHNGFPDKNASNALNVFEDRLTNLLQNAKNIGRKTYKNKRTIYFYADEFRECSRIAHQYFADNNHNINATFVIIKDKYWMHLNQLWGE